ncbi:hypothetical protein PCANC_09486 [Puccinia coronata f. sp. avenae]|uniref:Uncharacterized protein n=1 Tax=Puccinia coronata f. sp. avenae TaxID=200324 RepID=A0A2N5VVJ4_9BASI|nr:hypothetical protein PCANC_09486 [Puccinia coronata f. sp. avenae]
MEIFLDGLTADQFNAQVSSHLSAHVCYLPVWLIVEEAEEARALEWTYRVQDRVDGDLAFTEERKISGYEDDGVVICLCYNAKSTFLEALYGR